MGVGVPAKGDSASNVPLDDGATISDAPKTPPPPAKPPIKPTTRVVNANPDVTISDSLAGMSRTTASRISNIYLQTTLLQPGDLIGARYEILQLLGEGGMGAVYKALDHEVERTVALKLISAGIGIESGNSGAIQAGTADRAPGYAQERHPHLRHCRSGWREVHHHGVR